MEQVLSSAQQYNEAESIRAVQPEEIRSALPTMPQIHIPSPGNLGSMLGQGGARQQQLSRPHEPREDVAPAEPSWLGFDQAAAPAPAPEPPATEAEDAEAWLR